jgi:hypothetical protein
LVERQPSKLNVAGSNPVSRSKIYFGVINFKGIVFSLKFFYLVVSTNSMTRMLVLFFEFDGC